jgi:Family of unknown function (DUF695)
MNFLNKLFGKNKITTIRNQADFWQWFQSKEASFIKTLKTNHEVDKDCMTPIMDHLQQLNERFYIQIGMSEDEVAELIITPEGDLKSFVFVEEFVANAPKIGNWMFTALKPSTKGSSIRMHNTEFNEKTLRFYTNDDPNYPDEIDIVLVHKDFIEEDEPMFLQGSLIYLDTILGEFNACTLLDSVKVTGKAPNGKDLIPIEKLNDFLIWREKEFVEKYEEPYTNEAEESYGSFELETNDGLPIVAIMNQNYLEYDAKPTYPWMLVVLVDYEGDNGMPDRPTYEFMDDINEELNKVLRVDMGYLNIGRITGNNKIKIYFACKEFRTSSKIVANVLKQSSKDFKVEYEIFKDKCWMSLNSFYNVH